MKLDIIPFEKIKSGEKTVEIRLYDEKRRQIKAGDSITFTCLQSGEKITAEVEAVNLFDSFLSLFKSPLFSKCGVRGMSVNEAADGMYQYYTRENEKKYGVVGIEIKI